MNGTQPEDGALQFSTIPEAVADFAAGKFLIVLDSPDRENEGDIIIAARHLTPAKCGFLIRHSSGYLCCPMSPARAKELDLNPMVPQTENTDPLLTAYTISCDGMDGQTTTGISARDRTATANMLADSQVSKDHFRKPGHILPLIAKDGGVRVRMGHTEAALDLCRLAGIYPEVAVIGEMVVDGEAPQANTDGSYPRMIPEYHGAKMMRAKECLEFGRIWGIRCCTIEDLKKHLESGQDAGR